MTRKPNIVLLAPDEMNIRPVYNGQQFGLYTSRMIRTQDLKLIWNLTDIDELYDLSIDLVERMNRIKDPAYSGRLKELRIKLYQASERS